VSEDDTTTVTFGNQTFVLRDVAYQRGHLRGLAAHG